MAARARRIIVPALWLALNVWLVALASVLAALIVPGARGPVEPVNPFPHGELRVGIDASFPPFGVVTADGDLAGLDVAIAEELGARLGLPVRFVNLGFDGLYDSLRVDQVDVVISALLVNPLRRGEVHYTTPYFNAGLVLVTPSGGDIDSMRDLPGRSLAYQYGSLADAESRRWLRRVEPFATRPYELAEYALDAARLGEADAALVDAITARLYLRDHPDWSAAYHYVTDNPFAAATRRDQIHRFSAINSALNRMIEDGTLRRLIDEWL